MNSPNVLFDYPDPKDFVLLIRDGNQIIAMVGRDLQSGVGGFGNTISEALRKLADNMEKEGWKSRTVV